MIFTPYPDEALVIERIQRIRSDDYVLFRLTPTMIEKNNLDANEFFRDLLLNHGLVDYETIENGGSNGISLLSQFILPDSSLPVRLKFYRVNNSRGDRRFSIECLKRKKSQGILNVGDLLYISVCQNRNGEPLLYVINLSRNCPTEDIIQAIIGLDPIMQKFNEIRPHLKEILQGGFYDNSKGSGAFAPKDVGDTLESLLNVSTNNRTSADLDGLIELKAKSANTRDTLFTLRPHFEGTPVATFEPDDRKRVSAFARLYGYHSDSHPHCRSLYITIGPSDRPQNNQGFFLEVNESDRKISLMHTDPENQHCEEAAFWYFDDIRAQLLEKHPATLWFQAEKRTQNSIVQFKFTDITFSRSPQFMTFLSLVKSGVITYDWRGYTAETGKYTGKNHGNAWRIKPSAKAALFGEMRVVDL